MTTTKKFIIGILLLLAGLATATISYIFSTAGTFVLTPCYSGDSNYGPINTVP
jgi:hypothetical protein